MTRDSHGGLTFRLAVSLSLFAIFPHCGVGLVPEVDTPFARLPDQSLIPLSTSNCDWNPEGKYTEAFSESHGEGSTGFWTTGGGCILRPIRETWALTHNQGLMKWNDVSEFRASTLPPEKNLTHHYEVTYIVHNTVTVDWTIAWYHSIISGSMELPGDVLINYQKIHGTTHIENWEGSILLDAVDDNVTGFTIRNVIRGDSLSGINQDKSINAAREVYEKLQKGGDKYPNREPNWSAIGGK